MIYGHKCITDINRFILYSIYAISIWSAAVDKRIIAGASVRVHFGEILIYDFSIEFAAIWCMLYLYEHACRLFALDILHCLRYSKSIIWLWWHFSLYGVNHVPVLWTCVSKSQENATLVSARLNKIWFWFFEHSTSNLNKMTTASQINSSKSDKFLYFLIAVHKKKRNFDRAHTSAT